MSPEHFAEVGGHFMVGEFLQGLAQQALGLVEVAQAIVDPAEAVENRRVVRVELVRFLDQLARFFIAGGAVGQGGR